MKKSLETQVAIVGGGPVGVGLAIDLALRGIDSIVLEKHGGLQPIPKGQNLTQRTMEHMRSWGIEGEVRAARTIPPQFGAGGLTAYGTLLGDYHYDWLQRELVSRFYFADNERLPQYATERVLRTRAASLPLTQVMLGWEAIALATDGEGVRIGAIQAKGTDTLDLRARFVVGCDGSGSIVRKVAPLPQTLSDADRLMVLLVFRSSQLHQLLSRYPGKSFFNVLRPEYRGYWAFFGRVDLGETWFFHAPVPADTTPENYDFAGLLHRVIGTPFEVAFDHIGFWNLRFAVADRYREGPFFIAGDAAHSHPPYGGYGLNSGLEDSRNLAWKLAAVLHGWAGEDLLDSYGAERQPVFSSTARAFIARAIERDEEFVRSFDPTRDPRAFEEAWKARAGGTGGEVDAFEPNYEGSPIVWGPPGGRSSAVGNHALAARAGHHLSPPQGGEGRALFDRLGRGFSLIRRKTALDPAAPFVEAARRRGVPLSIVEVDDQTADTYGADLVLVRPDHFVAWAGDARTLAEVQMLERMLG